MQWIATNGILFYWDKRFYNLYRALRGPRRLSNRQSRGRNGISYVMGLGDQMFNQQSQAYPTHQSPFSDRMTGIRSGLM
jgi:hypothetical protein